MLSINDVKAFVGNVDKLCCQCSGHAYDGVNEYVKVRGVHQACFAVSRFFDIRGFKSDGSNADICIEHGPVMQYS